MPDPLDADGRQALPPGVVIVGEFWRGEFAALLEEMADLIGPQRLQAYSSLESLIDDTDTSETARCVELIVVLQSWPEQYTQRQVFDLLDLSPLARLLVCYGPWCDSDGRTRDIWPLAARVCHSQAAVRLRREWDVLMGRTEPLPLTAGRDELYRFDHAGMPRRKLPGLSIEVRTPDPAIRDLIARLLRLGNGSVRETPQAEPDLLIWDVDPWCADLAEQITGFRRERSRIPILAVAGFTRTHETAQLRQCGVDAVLAKTAPADEYLGLITDLCSKVAHCQTHQHSPAASVY